MKTIPLHQLAAYLPYETKVTFMYKRKQVIGTLDAVYKDGTITCGDTINASPDKFKLMLVPVNTKILGSAKDYNEYSDLIDILHYKIKQNIDNMPYRLLQLALEKNYDIFDLIPQGLATEKLSTSVKFK